MPNKPVGWVGSALLKKAI